MILTFVTVIAPVGDAFGLLVHGPVVPAGRTDGAAAARRAPNRTRHALVPFFVPKEPIRAGIEAPALVSKPASSAQDALRLGRSVARHTGGMTVGTTTKGERETGRLIHLLPESIFMVCSKQ